MPLAQEIPDCLACAIHIGAISDSQSQTANGRRMAGKKPQDALASSRKGNHNLIIEIVTRETVTYLLKHPDYREGNLFDSNDFAGRIILTEQSVGDIVPYKRNLRRTPHIFIG